MAINPFKYDFFFFFSKGFYQQPFIEQRRQQNWSVLKDPLASLCLIKALVKAPSHSHCWGFLSDYAHGVTMLSPFTSEKKQLVSFCSPSGEELRKFAEELREAIAEVNEMEQIHIQCKEAGALSWSSGWCERTQVEISLVFVLQGNWRGSKASSPTACTPTGVSWTHTQDTALLQVLDLLAQHNTECISHNCAKIAQGNVENGFMEYIKIVWNAFTVLQARSCLNRPYCLRLNLSSRAKLKAD